MAANTHVLRPAGYNEHRCIARDVLGLYGSIVTLGTYVSTHEAPPLIDVTYKALKHCIAQHAALSTVVHDADSEKPQLARMTRIHLDQHVHFLADAFSDHHVKAAISLLEIAHNRPLSEYEQRPQWQLWIAPSVSGSSDQAAKHSFHKTFLQALHNLKELQYDEGIIFEPPGSVMLPPPQEVAGTLTISWTFLLGPLVREYCPSWLAQTLGVSQDLTDAGGAAHAWAGASSRPKVQAEGSRLIKTNVHVVSAPQDVLRRVLDTCRQHGARLTGLLNHLFARALASALQAKGQHFTRFIAETALDLRRCPPAGKNQMANYVSAVDEVINVGYDQHPAAEGLSAKDWKDISETSKKLAQASSTLADQSVALLKYLSNFREWTSRNAEEPAKAAFGMSNLGTFSAPAGSDPTWKVSNMIFSQSANGVGTPFDVNVASAENGDLMIVISWCPGMLGVDDERAFVETFCNDVVRHLELL